MACVVKEFFTSRQSSFLQFFIAAMISGFAFAALAQTTVPPAVSAPSSSSSPQAATPPTSPSAPGVTGISPRYRISSGDELDVSVYGAPELSQRARVSGEGEIYLPLINKQHVAGLSLEAAQAELEKAFRDGGFLRAPHVNITVAGYANAVVVMGEVVKPGSYPLLGSGKLFDILSAAGGTTPSAARTLTISHADGTRENVILGRDPADTMTANVPLSLGDTVDVPKAGVVYVVGEVLSPAGIVMDQKIQYTVLKVIAMAHGATKGAKLSKTRIVRQTKTGTQEIPVPLDKIIASKAPDIPLMAEDIVFVPNNTAKAAANRAADVAIGLASGVALLGFQRY